MMKKSCFLCRHGWLGLRVGPRGHGPQLEEEPGAQQTRSWAKWLRTDADEEDDHDDGGDNGRDDGDNDDDDDNHHAD